MANADGGVVPPVAFFYPNRISAPQVRVDGVLSRVSNDFGAFCHENRSFIDRAFLESLPRGTDLVRNLVEPIPFCAQLDGTKRPGGDQVLGMLPQPLAIEAVASPPAGAPPVAAPQQQPPSSAPLTLRNVLVVDSLPVPLHVSTKSLGAVEYQRMQDLPNWGFGAGRLEDAGVFPARYYQHPYWERQGEARIGWSPQMEDFTQGLQESMQGAPEDRRRDG